MSVSGCPRLLWPVHLWDILDNAGPSPSNSVFGSKVLSKSFSGPLTATLSI